MLASTGVLPRGPGWSYEFKWDGIRVLVSFGAGGPRLWARSGADVTIAYPEIAALSLPEGSLLDGEMVVLDAAGRPSFTSLAERMHVRDRHKAARLAASVPASYMVFDLLRLGEESLLSLPYAERRERLEVLELGRGPWAIPPAFEDGEATAAAAREYRLEGVVAKRLTSAYVPGRSPDWVKVKFDRTGDFVIGGWRPGARKIGGLLVGRPGENGLVFRGRVGGGIGAAAERALLSALEPLVTTDSPFEKVAREDARGAIWVRPEVVVEVRYGNRTPDGRLRFPRFLRLRPDKTPDECMVEDDDGS
jgi:bifunctional non-homologous end joining protein LigD